ncbi:MAG: alpha/beta fold hydrolase [Anaerolineae bacterium]|jgi:carboxylesterase|nr:alpha/beta fold hydrolase [Anaerolineae bacterium]MBT7189695.1 alpha/beta fold hydrolase [Anaerolineae bacterium]MBT7988265.1 alpha/beta fold hydrolase [Anaerolineae bacterium]
MDNKTTVGNKALHNPHLDGDAFFWEGGSVGIFLSHGFTATTVEVRLLAEKLHAAGYTISAPLLPGHGTKPEDLNNVHWRDWIESGEESLQNLFKSCEQVWVGGASMGGMLALQLASKYPQISGVLLYVPAIRTMMNKMALLQLYLAAPFMKEIARDSLDGSDLWQGYPGLPLKGVIQFLRFQKATLKHLSSIRQPILIFQGRQDTTVAPKAGKIIMDGVSSEIKEHHWMENSSHSILLDEEYEDIARLSLEFIERNT